MKQSYSVWDEFDAREYGWRCYGEVMEVNRLIIIEAMKSIENLGLKPGSLQHIADVGTGPNLFPSMLLAPFVASAATGGQLDLIEYSQPNIRYLENIVAGRMASPPEHIWQKYEALMAEHAPVWRRTLAALKDVARIISGSIYDLPPQTYDAISSFFVAESITDSIDECQKAVTSLLAAVKPGGLVVVGHALGSTNYSAGENTLFPRVALSVEDLRRFYQVELDELTIFEPPLTPEVHDNYHGAVLVIGRKKTAPVIVTDDSLEKIFTAYGTQACLYDRQRVEYLKQAIFEAVHPGDVVVDAGSGTGVLGLLAVQAGASKVYCIEPNTEYTEVIKRNAKTNGMQGRVIVIQGDATSISLPESVDVIICEVISGGFFYEPQLQIMHNMRRFLRPGGRAVPAAMDNFIELVDAQDELYGLKFNHDTRHQTLNDISLTTKSKFLAVDFLQNVPFSISAEKILRCITPGKANAIRVPYAIYFSDSVIGTEPTDFLLNPQVIFLDEPLWLHSGSYYKVSLAYEAASSPLTCRVTVQLWMTPPGPRVTRSMIKSGNYTV
jgi:predicted RNA methylase